MAKSVNSASSAGTRHCPVCGTQMRPFGEGREAGWACPKCGNIIAKTLPRRYLLLWWATVLVVFPGLFAVFSPGTGALIFWVLVWAVAIVVLAILLAVPAFVAFRRVRGAVQKVQRGRAVIVRKRTRDWEVDVPPAMGMSSAEIAIRQASYKWKRDPGVTLAEWTDHYVTFRLGDQEIELGVPLDVYIDLEPGDEGLLVYRAEQFKHFIRGV